MEHNLQNETFELREYLTVLRRRKWTIILVTSLVVAAALAYSFQQTPMYLGSARLLIRGVPTDASGYVLPVNLQTEAEIVASEPVAARVIDELDLNVTTQALIAQLEVAPSSEVGEVLLLRHASSDPELARDVPNSFAENYIEHKSEQATAALELGAGAITDQINQVSDRLTRVTERLAAPGISNNPRLAGALQAEQNTMIARLGVLQQRLDDFQSRQPKDVSGGQLIESATLPGSPYSPNHLNSALRALVLGLGVGIGLAFLRERLDDRLRTRQELERATGLPVLATVPRFSVSNKTGREIVTISQPRGSASEAYRSLRTGLNFLAGQQQLQSVLLTSPSEGEGKTITCTNLAVALAQSGRRVMLMSADLRRPTLEDYFGLSREEGLTTWLIAEDREPWGLIRDPGIDNLRVVPSGPIPSNPAELLSSPRLTELIEVLEANSDIVLVDSPPVLAVADASILSTHVDGTILVVDSNKTHRSAAAQATQELLRIGARMLGTVYNGFDPSSAPYGQTYYGSPYQSQLPPEGDQRRASEDRRKSRLSFRR